MAKTFASAVTLVHVMQTQSEHFGPQMNDAVGWEISRQEAHSYLNLLEKKVSQALGGEPVEVRIEQGRPAERIVDVAREIGAVLTILGSHGEWSVPAWNLGSTAQQVLALVRGSVFIAHANSLDHAHTTSGTLKHILIPLDGSLRSESVLPVAARMAKAQNAELLLVHVVQEPLPTALLDNVEDLELAQKLAVHLESGAKRYLDRLQMRLARDGTSVHTLVVRHANECQCLLEISERQKTDLIVLSAHGSACDSARSFGSVTTYLLTHSMLPLLVLQDLPEGELHRTQDYEAKLAPPPLRGSFAWETV